jgi:hypothetical protein
MAATELTPQAVTNAGVQSHTDTGSYTAATDTDGYTFLNNGKCVIEIYNNGSSGDLTVTVDSPITCNQGGTHDVTEVISQGDAHVLGFFEPSRFNAANTGKVTISLSHIDTVSARVYKFS